MATQGDVKTIYGLEYTTGSFSKAVSPQTSTTLGTITFPRSGRWLVLSFMDSNVGSTGTMYINGLGTRSVRHVMTAGGGCINFVFTSESSIAVYGYADVACTLREHYVAIRISD